MSETPVFVDEKKIVGESSRLEKVSSPLIAERLEELKGQGDEIETQNDIPQNYFRLREAFRKAFKNVGFKENLDTQVDSKLFRSIIQELFNGNSQDLETFSHSLNVVKHLRESARALLPFSREIYSEDSEFFEYYNFETSVDLNIELQKIIKYSQQIGICHDLGKLLIPEKYRLHRENFSSYPKKEYAECLKLFRRHPYYGAKLIEGTLVPFVAEAIELHHSHFDRVHGYPRLRDNMAFPLSARLLGLTDSFCAMAEARSYGKRFQTREEIIAEIRRCSGTQFDPDLSRAFEEYYVNKVPPGELIFQTSEDLSY